MVYVLGRFAYRGLDLIGRTKRTYARAGIGNPVVSDAGAYVYYLFLFHFPPGINPVSDMRVIISSMAFSKYCGPKTGTYKRGENLIFTFTSRICLRRINLHL